MDRPLPTDPPDEPVNRIEAFLKQSSALDLAALLLPKAPLPQISACVPQSSIASLFEQAWENATPETLDELASAYQKNPKDWVTVFGIAIIHFRNFEWKDARHYLELLLQLAPEKDLPFVMELLEFIRQVTEEKSS